jgi:hypothetical protein
MPAVCMYGPPGAVHGAQCNREQPGGWCAGLQQHVVAARDTVVVAARDNSMRWLRATRACLLCAVLCRGMGALAEEVPQLQELNISWCAGEPRHSCELLPPALLSLYMTTFIYLLCLVPP